jgi:aspartate kinase
MKEDADMETVLVSGVTYNKDEAKISVLRVPDMPGIAAQIFSPLSAANITVDMIIQNVSHEGSDRWCGHALAFRYCQPDV